MTRLRGRAVRGERVFDHAPAGHWCTTTMISSIRLDGSTACMTIQGPTTSEIFRIYVEQVLVPTLRPGDVVVLDNLSSHKDPDTIALIQHVGAEVLFLPPYSPDFNPIEKMWSKLKEWLRSAKARTEDTLGASIAEGLRRITPSDARGWFGSSGYSII